MFLFFNFLLTKHFSLNMFSHLPVVGANIHSFDVQPLHLNPFGARLSGLLTSWPTQNWLRSIPAWHFLAEVSLFSRCSNLFMIQLAVAAEWHSVSVRIPRRISPLLNQVAHWSDGACVWDTATSKLFSKYSSQFKARARVLSGTQRRDQRADAPEHITTREPCSTCTVSLYLQNGSKQNERYS